MANAERHIISASRRTDIPAFHGEWFRRRRAERFCETANPFSGQTRRVSLARDDVLGWVFWSRDYAPFIDTLGALHDEGQRFLCQFTINGFPRALDPRVPGIGRERCARSMFDDPPARFMHNAG